MARSVTRNRTLELGLASLEAKRVLDRQRIQLPAHPGDDIPELPADPTELSDSTLMTLFTQMTRWAEYLGSQLAAAEVDERYAEAALDKIKAIKALTALSRDAKTTVTAAKATMWADEDYLEAHGHYQTKHAYRKLVNVLFENTERKSALLSRELTRRVGRSPREGRADRYSE